MSQPIASRRQSYWDLRAAGNFIGGGSGAGLLVMAALAAFAGAPFRLALALGLAGVLLGLSLVWLEIGRPWRALNVFFHPRTSWMTREGIVAGLLLPVGLVASLTASALATAATALLAGGFLYCQARILRAARGIPAWRQAEIVPLILATGFAEGSGLYLLAGTATIAAITCALLAALAREAAWRAYREGLASTKLAQPSLAAFESASARGTRAAQITAMAVMVLALAAARFAPGASASLAAAAGALAAGGGWGLKAVLITRAAFTRPVAIPVMPMRGGGDVRAWRPSRS